MPGRRKPVDGELEPFALRTLHSPNFYRVSDLLKIVNQPTLENKPICCQRGVNGASRADETLQAALQPS